MRKPLRFLVLDIAPLFGFLGCLVVLGLSSLLLCNPKVSSQELFFSRIRLKVTICQAPPFLLFILIKFILLHLRSIQLSITLTATALIKDYLRYSLQSNNVRSHMIFAQLYELYLKPVTGWRESNAFLQKQPQKQL